MIKILEKSSDLSFQDEVDEGGALDTSIERVLVIHGHVSRVSTWDPHKLRGGLRDLIE